MLEVQLNVMQSTRQKTVSWPGATPCCPPVCGPNPLRGFGVTPGHGACRLRLLVGCFAAYERSRLCSELFKDRLSVCLDWKGSSMSLLKPPEPQIGRRRFFIRIEEPLALTMERYAEFLGTNSLEHVVGQALQFIFQRDTQFNPRKRSCF
jgi:hypothetical protein